MATHALSRLRKSRSFNSVSPILRLAWTGTSGTPRRDCRLGTSISMPLSAATSIMFNAITVGRCNSSNWLTRYRLHARLLASTMHTVTSGLATSAWRPGGRQSQPFRRGNAVPDCTSPANQRLRKAPAQSSCGPPFSRPLRQDNSRSVAVRPRAPKTASTCPCSGCPRGRQ